MATERRWKAVALLATGLAAGAIIAGTPAGAHVAGWTHNWNAHIKPKADPRHLPGGNLPRGRTLRGAYRIMGTDQGLGEALGSIPISFGFRLSAAPVVHFIPVGTPPPLQCPGTAASPQAARGHLCVYEVNALNVAGRVFVNPVTNTVGTASRFGVSIFTASVANGDLRRAGPGR